MRAIFLDIDGVIATPNSVRNNYVAGRGPDTQLYDGMSLAYVGRLVAETGAVLVLSSTWREGLETADPFMRAVMDNLFRQLEGVGAPVSDMTPQLPGADRSAEVGAWLDEHPCEAWVIIDDLARFDERPEVSDGHLVRIEDSEGIRHAHFERALQILGG